MAIRKVEIARLTAALAEIGVEAPPYTSARELRLLLAAEREKRGLTPVPSHPRFDAEADAAEVADRLAAEGFVRGQTHTAPAQTGPTSRAPAAAPTSAHSVRQPPARWRPYVPTAEQIVRHAEFAHSRQGRRSNAPKDGPGSVRADVTVIGATASHAKEDHSW